MALEGGTFAWGGTTYPLATSATTSNTALRDLDPPVYFALAYWTTVLQSYLGARWAEACAAAGGVFPALASTVVLRTVPYDPAPFLTEAQLPFPLLAAYRISGRFVEQSTLVERSDDLWGVDYVLPPMEPAEAERMMPFLRAVRDVLTDRTTEGHDPSYGPDTNVWGTGYAGVHSIGFTSWKISLWGNGKGLAFPCLSMQLACTERRNEPADAYDDLAGTDIEIAVKDPTLGTTVRHVVDVETD